MVLFFILFIWTEPLDDRFALSGRADPTSGRFKIAATQAPYQSAADPAKIAARPAN
ncbi:MAG TPA: hypothetical protein VNV18_10240 [Stellaceae bacterium]|jgi:hypothetical protein|nr:hypothetical protein [Stellaceae bacterium]